MPFKSEAQKKKFQEMVKEGKLTEEKYQEWEKDTPKNIPERVGPSGIDRIRKVAKAKLIK